MCSNTTASPSQRSLIELWGLHQHSYPHLSRLDSNHHSNTNSHTLSLHYHAYLLYLAGCFRLCILQVRCVAFSHPVHNWILIPVYSSGQCVPQQFWPYFLPHLETLNELLIWRGLNQWRVRSDLPSLSPHHSLGDMLLVFFLLLSGSIASLYEQGSSLCAPTYPSISTNSLLL